MKTPHSQLASHDQICMLLRKTGAQVDEAVKKSGLPREKGKAKQYNLQRVIHWLIDQHKKDIEDADRKRIEWPVGDIAAAMHRDVRTINILAKDKGLPRVRRGVYNIIDVFRFIIKDLEYKLNELKAGGIAGINQKVRLNSVLAETKELQLAKLRRSLVDLDEIMPIISTALNDLRQKSIPFAQTISPQLEGLGLNERSELIRDLLNELFEELSRIPDTLRRLVAIDEHRTAEGVQRSETAAKDESKRSRKRVSHAQQGKRSS